MLYHWLLPLESYFGPLHLFTYITFRAAMAGAFAIILTLVLGGPLVRLIKRLQLGQNIREEVPERHKGKAGTPTMGGVLMLAAGIAGVVLFGDVGSRQVLLGLLVLVGLGLLGLWDDYVKVRKGKPRGVNKRTKLAVQLLLALVVGVVLYFFPSDPAIRTKTNFLLFKNIVIDYRWLYIPMVLLVIVGSSNAVNLSDGLDGLAAGVLTIALGSYGVLCYLAGHFKLANYLNIQFVPGSGELTVYCLALMGACLGFLWFNVHPAEVFMGDTGSLPLGGALGFVAIVSRHELLLPLIGGVFVMEAGSVLLQIVYFRLTKGGRLFRMAPIHHHFELKGWEEPKVVARLLILAVLFNMVALASLKVR